jgi:hypothetical protein
MVKGNPALRIFLAGIALICFLTLQTSAQTGQSTSPPANAPTNPRAVKVESTLVLVPVFVYDPAKMVKAPKEELPCARATVIEFFKLAPTQPYLPKDCDVTEVDDLTAKDFRLFQDGKEQPIVRMDSGDWWTLVRDNFGWHIQSSDTPRAIWSLSELSAIKQVPVINRDFHVLAYVPPAATTTGCHSIKVEVDRPKLLVFARNQYCTGQTPSDLLYGTEEAKKLEHDLSSDKRGKIPVSLRAAALYGNDSDSRVDICFDFPSKDLYHKWDAATWTLDARIAVMGVVRKADGTVAARFSDMLYPPYWPTFDQGGAKFIAWEKGSAELSGALPRGLLSAGTTGSLGSSSSELGNDTLGLMFPAAGELSLDTSAIQKALNSSDPFWMPTRYETQVNVPPGQYTLEVAITDGWNVGHAEMPLNINADVGKQLALSSIALCKRLRDANVAIKEDAAADFAPQYVPLVSKGIEFIPAADTTFQQSEPLFAYFEVNEPSGAQPSDKVTVEMRILNPTSGAVLAKFAPLDASIYQVAGSSVLRIARTIPIRQLPKGSYRLQVRATDSAGASTPWRMADFTVE